MRTVPIESKPEPKVFLRLDEFRGWSAVAQGEWGQEVELVGPFPQFEECIRALVQREGKRVLVRVSFG